MNAVAKGMNTSSKFLRQTTCTKEKVECRKCYEGRKK